MARGGPSPFRQKRFARPASFRPGFYREEQLIVARDEHRGREAETRTGDRSREHELEDAPRRRLRDTAAIGVLVRFAIERYRLSGFYANKDGPPPAIGA